MPTYSDVQDRDCDVTVQPNNAIITAEPTLHPESPEAVENKYSRKILLQAGYGGFSPNDIENGAFGNSFPWSFAGSVDPALRGNFPFNFGGFNVF